MHPCLKSFRLAANESFKARLLKNMRGEIKILADPDCEVIRPISVDYNLTEMNAGHCWSIKERRFLKYQTAKSFINRCPMLVNAQQKSQFKPTSCNVTFAHLNVRSVRSRENFYLIWQTITDNCLDILTISESWLDPSINDSDLQIPRYILFQQDNGSLGGGLCVCIKDIYKVSFFGNLSNISENSFQQLWLKVNCKKLKSFLLCTVYRPPNTPISFLETLSKSFMDSLLVGSEVIILGDLNCNVLDDCYEARALTSFCSTFNLTQHVESPTRVTESSKSIIDIVLMTNKDFVKNCVVKSLSISNHNLVCFDLKLKAPRPRHSYVTIRSYKNYDCVSHFIWFISSKAWMTKLMLLIVYF